MLWLTHKGEGYVGAPSTQHGFEMAVAERCNCRFAGEGWSDYVEGESLDETVRRVMPDADWVIDKDNDLHTSKPDNRRYKIGHFISDLHGKWHYKLKSPVKYAQMVNDAGYDAVFLRYKELWGTEYRPDAFWDWLKCEKYWLPWSVDVKAYSPKHKDTDVSFIGRVSETYPLRQDIWDNLYYVTRGYRVSRHEPPEGKTYEREVSKLKETHLVGKDYRDALAKTRIFIFGCSKYRYPLQKFFEATASMCLVMCNEPSNAKQLGFTDMETYMEIDIGNWEEKLTWALENPSQVKRITRNGLKNTLMNHSHEKRSDEFVEMLSG